MHLFVNWLLSTWRLTMHLKERLNASGKLAVLKLLPQESFQGQEQYAVGHQHSPLNRRGLLESVSSKFKQYLRAPLISNGQHFHNANVPAD